MSQTPNQELLNVGMNFVPTIHNDTYPFISPLKQNLKGRSVFISGASKGIGQKTALSFAAAGCSQIALAARSALTSLADDCKAAAKKAGRPEPNVLALAVDVTDKASVNAAAQEVKDKFGRLDILINNAGALEPFVPLVESDPEAWWRSFEVNVKGVFLVSHALVPLMLETPAGLKTVMNVSSYGAHGIMGGGSAYRSAKLAVVRLTEFLDHEHGAQGLVAISCHPGGVVTELAMGMGEHMMGYLKDTPEMSADAMVWLTGQRKEWLSGRFVSCSWDMEELIRKREQIVEGDLLKVRMAVAVGA